MKIMRAGRAQSGAALIIMVTVLVMGFAWFAVGFLGKPPVGRIEREHITGHALQAAKRALLAHVAQYAARANTAEPGQLPCPESLTLSSPGEASPNCSNATATLGRLPWKTLGIDPLVDGDAEALWYAVSPGFRSAPINFGTPAALPFNGGTVVAVVIAPGRVMNTTTDPATPPTGCAKVDQFSGGSRYSAPLAPARFLECGNASGDYANLGTSQWTNDRVLAITAEEWADAIAGPVADRLQRQVAAALSDWDTIEQAGTGKSWGSTHSLPYLPYAANWGNPASANYCGDQDRLHGLMPIDPSCHNNAWDVISVNPGGLLSIWGGGNGCTDLGTHLRCRFERILGVGSPNAEITLRASDVARAFRGTLRRQDLSLSNNGSATISMSMSRSTSDATVVINASWPANLFLLGLGEVVSIDIPHLQAARVLMDPRVTWFRDNEWHRYTYYAIGAGAAVSPPAGNQCISPGDPGCLIVAGLPSSTGSADDKRLVLVLSGRPLAGQTQPNGNRASYFELDNNASNTTSPYSVAAYQSGASNATFNDRVATCPFRHQNFAGSNVVLCD